MYSILSSPAAQRSGRHLLVAMAWLWVWHGWCKHVLHYVKPSTRPCSACRAQPACFSGHSATASPRARAAARVPRRQRRRVRDVRLGPRVRPGAAPGRFQAAPCPLFNNPYSFLQTDSCFNTVCQVDYGHQMCGHPSSVCCCRVCGRRRQRSGRRWATWRRAPRWRCSRGPATAWRRATGSSAGAPTCRFLDCQHVS